MRIRTILGVVAALLLLAVAGLVVALLAIDPNSYRGLAERQAEAALGRDVAIAGDMDLEIGLTPTIVLNEVEVANIEGGSREHMATVERIEAEVRLLPLIDGDVRVDRIVVVGADVLLETDGDGKPNWRFGGTGGSGGAPGDTSPDGAALPHIASIAIAGSEFAYAGGGATRTLSVADGSIDAGSPDSPIELSLEGALDGVPLSLNAVTGSLRALTAGQSWAIDVEARLADASLSADGTVTRPLEAAGADLSVSLDLPSGEAIAAIAGGDPPALPSIALETRLVDREDHLALSGLRLAVGDTAFTGDLRLVPTRDPIFLAGGLSAETIDVAAFAGGGEGSGGSDGGDDRLIPATPIPYRLLGVVDADLGLGIDRLVLGSERIEAVSAELRIDGGQFTLDLADARVAGGRVSGRLSADASAEAPSIDLTLAAERIDLGGLLARQAGSADLQGPLDLDVAIAGPGATVREVVAGGNGHVGARLGRSTVATRYLDLVGASLISALLPDFEQRTTSTVNCAVARLGLSGGALHTGGLVIDTPQATIAGEGGIDLLSERIEMTLRPQPKSVSLVPLAAPVRVHGPLASPSYSVNPVGLATDVGGAVLMRAINPLAVLVPLVDPGSGSGNACVAALSEPQPAPGPGGAPQRLLEGVGGAAEGAGRAAGAVGRGVGEALGGAADEAGRALEGLFGD